MTETLKNTCECCQSDSDSDICLACWDTYEFWSDWKEAFNQTWEQALEAGCPQHIVDWTTD